MADEARSLGVNDQTLGNWVRRERIDRGEREGLTSSERAELTQLRRENRQLRQERELLKKATAFFVQESTGSSLPVDQHTEGRGLWRRPGLSGHGGLVVGLLRVATPSRATQPP